MSAFNPRTPVWLASGLRTPFVKVDGPFAQLDAIALSVPVVQAMIAQLDGTRPDVAVWGTVAPNLTWSNIAREVLLDAGVDATIPAFSTVMACSTSMIGAFEAAGMIDGEARNLALVGGVESMSRIQLGLGQRLSDWVRGFQRARSLGQKIEHVAELKLSDVRLYIPSVTNRTSGMSMGEHTEITVKTWDIGRQEQDELALASHRKAIAGWEAGFFTDLVMPLEGTTHDTIPRKDTSLEKLGRLPPVFDRTSGKGTLTAGNSSPLTDGAAALWVGSEAGMARLPAATPRVQLIDFEVSAVDFRTEGLLMAPAYAVPRLLARHGLTYADIDLWEIHEAFAGQLAFHMKAWEDADFLRDKVRIEPAFGAFPRDRVNPNGGSTALGHPFGATGARILSQAVKELAALPAGAWAIVSICADGGLGTVALLRNPPSD
ncbi:MAG: acetyl-CoA C-acyltransferase [Caulobacteraceae bacterium]|nr:acetyl-CoA C-acyltransferase [Caulobacteraceae bacterium]